MQVHTIAKEHPLQNIANSGATPMTKTPIKLESRDDRMAGNILAAEVLAFAKGHRNVWKGFALRIITDLTVEARAVFIKALKNEKAALTKAQTEHGFESKFSKVNTASMTTEVSKLTTIANAFNSGATVAGWREYVNRQLDDKSKHAEDDAAMLEHGSYDTLVAYSKLFSTSAAGRKADDWLTKFGKFLERNKPAEDDAKGAEFYEQAVKFYNGLNKG